MQQDKFTNQAGLTLVEVLASILILSIIVVTFLTFFVQSAKTTNMSEDVLDGSYVAQNHIETIYFEAEQSNFNTFLDAIREDATSYQSMDNAEKVVQYHEEYKIETTIEPVKDTDSKVIEDLYTVVVKVYHPSNQLKAQMETKLYFDGQEE